MNLVNPPRIHSWFQIACSVLEDPRHIFSVYFIHTGMCMCDQNEQNSTDITFLWSEEQTTPSFDYFLISRLIKLSETFFLKI